MTTEEMIAVMRNYTTDDQLEIALAGTHDWRPCTGSMPLWNWNNYVYRIKPIERKPREWLIDQKHQQVFSTSQFATRSAAIETLVRSGMVHVREVLPE